MEPPLMAFVADAPATPAWAFTHTRMSLDQWHDQPRREATLSGLTTRPPYPDMTPDKTLTVQVVYDTADGGAASHQNLDAARRAEPSVVTLMWRRTPALD